MFTIYSKWSWQLDLNQRPADYKSAALPTELCQLENFLERETGLEPATYSLEGCRSSQLSYSRTLRFGCLWWGEQDSNL
jgi:hypothetical protein